MHDELRTFMAQAIKEANRSPADDARVGAVIVQDGVVVATGHKGETAPRRHAEVVALDKAAAAGIDLAGATAFVTLEPCANLENNRIPCAQRLVDAGIATVYIGRYDRMFRVYRQGWKLLNEQGILCRDFPEDLRAQLGEHNAVFEGYFLRRNGLTGKARFDPTQNGRSYQLATDDGATAQVWTTRWSSRDHVSMYANGGRPGIVALAKYATDFAQIDDPSAYDFSDHVVPLAIGDIAIYRNEHGYALVRLLKVEPGPPRGETPHTSMTIDYELRPTASSTPTDTL